MRELNPSKQSKYGLVPPLLELALFAHFNDKTRGQFEEINVMKLSRNFNKHNRNVFEQNNFEYDFEAQSSPSIQHPDQVSKILSGLFGPSQHQSPTTIRLLFLPFSAGVYLALILD